MREDLHHMISRYNGKRMVFAGVGNLLKHDDGVGVYITRQLENRSMVQSLVVEVSIENYIGKILKLAPDVLIIVDAVDFGMMPGHHELLQVSDLMDTTTNTHNISLARLESIFAMPVYVLGIQPGDLSFGEGMSPSVHQAADYLIEVINTSIRNYPHQTKKEAI